jgi:hypothetical protein
MSQRAVTKRTQLNYHIQAVTCGNILFEDVAASDGASFARGRNKGEGAPLS